MAAAPTAGPAPAGGVKVAVVNPVPDSEMDALLLGRTRVPLGKPPILTNTHSPAVWLTRSHSAETHSRNRVRWQQGEGASAGETTEAAGASAGSTRKRGSSSTAPSGPGPKQVTLSRSFEAASSFKDPDGKKNLAMREALLYMICRDTMPLQTSEKAGFRHFCKVTVPLSTPPSRGTMTSLMEDKYKKCSALVKDTIAELEAYCMTSDIWTEKHTVKSYLGVTLHFLDKKSNSMDAFRLGLVPLDGAHTSAYIGGLLDEVCDDWGIVKDRVKLFVTDNAENMKKAIVVHFGPAVWQPCFAHTINLVADSLFKTFKDREGNVRELVHGLEPLIKKTKKIATFTKHSVKTSDELRRIQIEDYNRSERTCLKLQQDVSTRWSSTYLMLERFLEMSDIVSAALLKAKDAPEMLSGGEMYTCRLLLKVFRPFYQITLELSGHKVPTASKVVPLLHLAKQALTRVETGNDLIAMRVRDVLLKAMNDYFGNIEQVRPYVMATMLDTRFKDLHFSSIVVSSNVVSYVPRELKEVMRGQKNQRDAELAAMQQSAAEVTTEPDNLLSLHDTAAASRVVQGEEELTAAVPLQLREYRRRLVLSREGDPYQQWAAFRSDLPELHTVAMRYLPLLASSVPSESYFSLAGYIASPKRSRLTAIAICLC
ncbi:E3 SUMO-protein ligase ZBED1 [Frankliniella fusca]|uniref:E3 SUMO-protein ligase ZBED1 n=1 Tax=Frankliniella fusca TaxID=407009 RepID=A0AAE1H400_9NEOP|nr:E3 SUMO-protein ligase ZBED1 [Frankliniella fusca]